jgi:hypothetical protein
MQKETKKSDSQYEHPATNGNVVPCVCLLASRVVIPQEWLFVIVHLLSLSTSLNTFNSDGLGVNQNSYVVIFSTRIDNVGFKF